jgi:tRNA 2-thiouridine synthesizing protein E
MATQTIDGHEVQVDEEGFMTDPGEWSEEIAKTLANQIAIDTLTDDHWRVIRFLRDDYEQEGETATLRRVSTVGGVPTKQLYQLFPKKPAKKMAYVSGLPKPKGCV